MVWCYGRQHKKAYIKTGVFDKSISKIVASASKLREKSDYVDFYIASRQESQEQIEKAGEFLKVIEDFLIKKLNIK